MSNELSVLQDRFGDRFPEMHLLALEPICWPVFRHSLKITVRENVPLDPLEEGLLRLVLAGVADSEELAGFLGCSPAYARTMATSLSHAGNRAVPVPLAMSGERCQPTATTVEALRVCERPAIGERNLNLYRDAVFGSWLSRGRRFGLLTPGDTDAPTSRWLGPVVDARTEDKGVIADVLQEMGSTSQGEVLESELSPSGNLQWLSLKLACYQSEDLRRGRFLLFNSLEENEPLPDLSADFERLLASRKTPQLYFPDDAVATGASFWNSLSTRIRVLDRSQELAAKQEHFEKVRTAFAARLAHPDTTLVDGISDELRPASPAADPAMISAALSRGEDGGRSKGPIPPADEADKTTRTVDSATREAEARLSEALRNYETEIEQLRLALAKAPVTQHLETKDHPPLLKEALKSARHTVLIISPWIKMRVLRNFLPELDDALRRGCEVWIGYGMPPSTIHKDKSDPEAIDALRTREARGLRLVDMWTHEKVLVVDDELYVNTSFNWLSYSGGDGRRESGLLQRGGIQQFRDRFLADFKTRYEKLNTNCVGPATQG